MYKEIHEQGYLLSGEVCRQLGISFKVYRRLEANGVFPVARRWAMSPRALIRTFRPGEVRSLRASLRRETEATSGLKGRFGRARRRRRGA
jgi:hypothetical protein